MAGKILRMGAGFAAAFFCTAQATAQEPASVPLDPDSDTAALAAEADANAAINPDEMADSLNAQQQIKQSYTFTRTINGEVVETGKRSITYSRHDPIRATESGGSALQDLRDAFDSEVLTRTEAFEEAKLDFTAADSDLNNLMSADEFTSLVIDWRGSDARTVEATDEEAARQRQYDAFFEELDPGAARAESAERARQKFYFMSGAAEALNREDYIREYLLDFDSMDKNGDMILRGDELLQFRALNRGEAMDLTTTP